MGQENQNDQRAPLNGLWTFLAEVEDWCMFM